MTRPTNTIAITALALAALPSFAAGQQRWSEPWTLSSGKLLLDVAYATVTVRGHDEASVDIVIAAEGERPAPVPEPVLDGDRVLIEAPGNSTNVTIEVRVPRFFEAEIRSSNGGPVRVGGLHGPLSVENSNAGVWITGARAATAVTTSNGPIVAAFETVPERASLSLITSNDSVSVTLPVNVGADVHLGTDNGRIESAFDIVPETAPRALGRGVSHGSSLRGTIGAGGPTLRVRTDNGAILLHRAR